MNGLARKLISDSHLAEDVVQDAWVLALTHGGGARSSLSPWIAGVVKHLARNRTRGASRRRDREERSARPDEVPSTSVTSEKLEQQRLLIESVLALRDPYRTAIMARYIEEKPPREIARELKLSVATVHSQLTRGLTMLREDLVKKHGGDETRWLSAMVSLSGLSSKDGMVLTGALLMKSKLVVLSAIFLILFSGWHALAALLASKPNAPLEIARVDSDVELATAAKPTQSTPEVGAHERVPDAGGAEATFMVRVVDGPSGEPVPGAKVFMVDPALREQDLESKAVERLHTQLIGGVERILETGEVQTTDEQGQLAVPVARLAWEFCATTPRGVAMPPDMLVPRTMPREAKEGDLLLEVWPTAEIRARVLDEGGRPAVGVSLAVAPNGLNVGIAVSHHDMAIVLHRATTDERGEVVLRPWLPEGGVFEAWNFKQLRVYLDVPNKERRSVPIQLDGQLRTEVELTCGELGRVELELFASEGVPVADGTPVALWASGTEGKISRSILPGVMLGRVHAGRVNFDHVGVGVELDVHVVLDEHQHAWTTQIDGPTSELIASKHRLVAGMTKHEYIGQLINAEGELYVRETFGVSYVPPQSAGYHWESTTDERGRFRIELIGLNEHAPEGSLHFAPTVHAFEECGVERLLAANENRIHDLGAVQITQKVNEVAPERRSLQGAIQGEVLADEDVDLANVRVAVWNLSQGPPGASRSTGWKGTRVRSDKRFAIHELEPGPHALEVKIAPDGGRVLFLESIDVFANGENDPRVATLDLRGLMRTVDLTMTGPSGFPIVADFWFLPDDGGSFPLGSFSRVSLPSDAEGAFVGLVDSALPSAMRLGAANRYDLRLPVGQEVVVRWAGERALEEYEAHFTVNLTEFNPTKVVAGRKVYVERTAVDWFCDRYSPREAELKAGETSNVLLPGPGRYILGWSKDGGAGGSTSGGFITIEPGQTVLEVGPDEAWASAPR